MTIRNYETDFVDTILIKFSNMVEILDIGNYKNFGFAIKFFFYSNFNQFDLKV